MEGDNVAVVPVSDDPVVPVFVRSVLSHVCNDNTLRVDVFDLLNDKRVVSVVLRSLNVNTPEDQMKMTTQAGSIAADELLTTAEVSAQLKVPVATLRYYRHKGIGPRSFRLGPRKVMYRRSDVVAWLEAQYNAEQVGA